MPASPRKCARSRSASSTATASASRVSQIAIENVAPPAEVADAFDEVQRAEQDEDRFQEEARQYANTLLGDARGQAAQIREDAAAYKNRVVKEADGEAARFLSVYNEYAKAPEVTRKRLFLETMEAGARAVPRRSSSRAGSGHGRRALSAAARASIQYAPLLRRRGKP